MYFFSSYLRIPVVRQSSFTECGGHGEEWGIGMVHEQAML
jgi:hypothetical protein